MTVAFEVKKRIIAMTKAAPAFADLAAAGSVWDSAYVDWQRPRQLIWFGEITWEQVAVVAMGIPGGRRQETFNIRIGIEISDADATQTEADDKAEALLDALEAMLQDPRDVAVAGLQKIIIQPVGLGEGPGDGGGRAALLAAQINVTVRK